MRDEAGCPRGGGCRCGGGRRGGGRGARWLLEPAVLATLGAGPTHGYDVRVALDDLTAGLAGTDPGGLYRLLRRMEDDGLVVSTWEAGKHGPQRRTYRLTDDGRDVLADWLPRLRARRRSIDEVLAAAESVLAGSPTTTSTPTTSSTDHKTDQETHDDDAR